MGSHLKETGWDRFERYTIERDILVPDPDAHRVQWQPWAAYYAIESERRTVEPPYTSLLEVSQRLVFQPSREKQGTYAPSGESRQESLDWCNQHGLLGVFSALSRRMTLAPQWFWSADVRVEGRPRWVPGYVVYVREAGGWERRWHIDENAAAQQLSDDKKGLERVVPPEVSHGWPCQQLEFWSWQDLDWREEPLTKRLATFFPAIQPPLDANYPYPLPGSPEFWAVYGEPLETFAFWIARYRESVEVLSQYVGLENPTDQQQESIAVASKFLQFLASGTGMRLDIGATVSRALASPSLLCTFAEMFLRDLASGRRAHRCQRCGRFYVSNAPRAQYCSARCRNATQRRRQRKRQSIRPQ